MDSYTYHSSYSHRSFNTAAEKCRKNESIFAHYTDLQDFFWNFSLKLLFKFVFAMKSSRRDKVCI